MPLYKMDPRRSSCIRLLYICTICLSIYLRKMLGPALPITFYHSQYVMPQIVGRKVYGEAIPVFMPLAFLALLLARQLLLPRVVYYILGTATGRRKQTYIPTLTHFSRLLRPNLSTTLLLLPPSR